MKKLICLFFVVFGLNLSYSQCNTNTSICTPGVAGPFNFIPASNNPSTCLDFWNGAGTPNYGYIVLYITQSGPLNLLVNGNNNSGYIDVAVFNITGQANPCASLSPATQLSCNYASSASGCAQFGNAFPCASSVAAPNVTAGQVLMILVEDWSNAHSSFTLQLGPPPGAQTGPPDATINPVGSLCVNASSIQLTAVNGGGTWSGPGTSSAGVFNPATAGPGTHTINYSLGVIPCNSTGSTQITVNSLDNAQFSYPQTVYCNVGTTTPTATLPGGVYSGAGITFVSTSTGEINLSTTPPGNYTITYTTNGPCPNSSTFAIQITSSPTTNFSYTTPVCENTSNQSPIFGPGAGAGTFTSTPAGLSIDPSTGVINVSSSAVGTYTVTNDIPASGGCSAATHSTTFQINPTDDAGFSYSSSSYCITEQQQSPSITGLAGGTFSVSPITGLNLNNNSGHINPSLSTPGTYTITYTTNGLCPNTSSVVVTIDSQLDATITPAGPFCNNDGLVILVPVTPGGVWSGLGITDSINGIFDPAIAGNGSHIVTYTLSGDCGSSSSITIVVSGPIASFSATPSSGIFPLIVDFINNSTGTGLSYLWDFGDGNGSITQNPTNTYANEGIYNASLIVTDANGCTDTVSITISVVGEIIVLIPNIFSPNGDGVNDVFILTTVGIENIEMSIYNRWGQNIFISSGFNPSWDGKISGNNADEGTYYYVVKTRDIQNSEKTYTGHLTLLR
ncbi:MAG: gliding motility-associated C-terminal domain-containing protein [Flavobacteriales bacterium]